METISAYVLFPVMFGLFNRFKAFLPELPMDEASLEWCLRPQNVDREVRNKLDGCRNARMLLSSPVPTQPFGHSENLEAYP